MKELSVTDQLQLVGTLIIVAFVIVMINGLLYLLGINPIEDFTDYVNSCRVKYHKKQMDRFCEGHGMKFGYAEFDDFKIEFDKAAWAFVGNNYIHSVKNVHTEIENQYNNLWSLCNPKCNPQKNVSAIELSEGIIVFNNIGMIMKSEKSYLKVRLYVKGYIEQHYDKIKRDDMQRSKELKLAAEREKKKREITWHK